MAVRRLRNSITISGNDLKDLKRAMRDSLLGVRKRKLKPGEVQCPFCGDIYMPTNKEHFISGICARCWPDEPEEEPDDYEIDDNDKPF